MFTATSGIVKSAAEQPEWPASNVTLARWTVPTRTLPGFGLSAVNDTVFVPPG